MFFKLFLIFAVVPLLELGVLIKIGTHIGAMNTIALVILTAIVGAYMVRQEGLGVLYRMQRDMNEGIFPADEIINGAMILVAGALLLTPGVFTDLIGFMMVFPLSRNFIRKYVKRYIEKKISPRDIRINGF